MSDLYLLTDEQMTRLQPYFPKSHGKPRVDDRRVLSGVVFVKSQRCHVQLVHEHIDDTNRTVLGDVIVNTIKHEKPLPAGQTVPVPGLPREEA